MTPNIIAPHPANLPLPHHVHCLVAPNRSPGRVKFAKALRGVNPAMDRVMVLLDRFVKH